MKVGSDQIREKRKCEEERKERKRTREGRKGGGTESGLTEFSARWHVFFFFFFFFFPLFLAFALVQL